MSMLQGLLPPTKRALKVAQHAIPVIDNIYMEYLDVIAA
jgi:hypothetical protein